MQKVIVITGPTAVGKTKLSIEIAKRLKTDIINADAYQVYRKMNIGTAKPTKEEMQKVHHHLIDILDPRETFSISDYQRIVRTLIEKMKTENKVPLLVGGSGLYIDAVIKNYNFNEEKRCDENYNKYTNSELHQILKGLDCEMASKIHPNNRKRLIRAIELAQQPYFKNSRSLGKDFYYDVLCIFLNDNRDSLYQRINNRVDQMIKHGLVEEVRQIGIENFSITSKVAIGYKEMIEYLKGNIDLDEAIELIKKNSRHYAKRQYTWFKNKVSSTIVPINLDDFNHTINEVEKIINNFLS